MEPTKASLIKPALNGGTRRKGENQVMKTKSPKPFTSRVRASRTLQKMARTEGALPASRPEIASILVPTDFSKPSETALAYAVPLARQIGAKLTLLHVIEPIATPDFAVSFPLVIENEKAKKFCEDILTQTAEKFGVE